MNTLEFSEDEKTGLRIYDDVSEFLFKKLTHDIPFAKIDRFVNCRNLNCFVITSSDLTITLTLEIGYIEFCGIEYDFNLFDLVKLIKAIQHYLLKYSKTDITKYLYIKCPWGW